MYFCGDLGDLAWLSRLPLSSDHMWKPEAGLVARLSEAGLSYSGRMTSVPSHTVLCVILLVSVCTSVGRRVVCIFERVYVLKRLRELESVGVEGVRSCCVLVSGEACFLRGTGLGSAVCLYVAAADANLIFPDHPYPPTHIDIASTLLCCPELIRHITRVGQPLLTPP